MSDADLEKEPSLELDAQSELGAESSKVRMGVLAVSAAVFLSIAVVVYMLPAHRPPGGPSALATLNAFLNSCSMTCLVLGFLFIKTGNIQWHRRAMLSAFGFSSMFLLTYLLHHARVGSVPFQHQGIIRTVYFSVLIPHIILSAAVVPMAILTIYRGWTNRISLHRRLARITLPLWLYVSASGVAVYYMLYHL